MKAYNLRRRWKKLRRMLLGRPDRRAALLERMPKHAVCAEIGVWEGEFSARILAATDPKQLHLIDPWAFQPQFPGRGYGGGAAGGQRDMDRMYEAVRRRFAACPNVVIHRALSDAALASFPDGFFDWVYIDANHEYDFVRKDLELAYRKVRAGGLIMGDDYNWGEAQGFPVRRALESFIEDHSIAASLEVLQSQFIVALPQEKRPHD